MTMRIYLPMRIDADIRIIWHMLDIAWYCRIMRNLMRISASAWPSLVRRFAGYYQLTNSQFWSWPINIIQHQKRVRRQQYGLFSFFPPFYAPTPPLSVCFSKELGCVHFSPLPLCPVYIWLVPLSAPDNFLVGEPRTISQPISHHLCSRSTWFWVGSVVRRQRTGGWFPSRRLLALWPLCTQLLAADVSRRSATDFLYQQQTVFLDIIGHQSDSYLRRSWQLTTPGPPIVGWNIARVENCPDIVTFLHFCFTSLWWDIWRISSLKSHSLCRDSKVALTDWLTQWPRSGIELPGQLIINIKKRYYIQLEV